jgi:putative ABC transport system permease protein
VLEQARGGPEERHRYLTRVVEALSAVPGVRDVALTSALPLQGWGSELPCDTDVPISADRATRPTCFFKMISPSYFSTLGLPLRAGRGLLESDGPDGARVAVINETLARRYSGGQRAVGQRIVLPELVAAGRARLGPDIAWQVVGVVADERVSSLQDPRESPGVYVSLAQSTSRRPALVIRAAMDPRVLEHALREAVATVNRDQPLADLRTLDEIKSDSLGSERQRSWLLAAFAVVSLVLAAIGIYGVLSYSVLQRTRELGIRAAVGASAEQLVGLVLWDGAWLTGLGLALGVAGTLAVSGLLQRFLFGVGAIDVRAILLATVTVAGVALVACVLPARRATKADPLIALRSQ